MGSPPVPHRSQPTTWPRVDAHHPVGEAADLGLVVADPDDGHARRRPPAGGSAVRAGRTLSASSMAVGSSISSTDGRVASVRARQARCASPPERSRAARSSSAASRPTWPRAAPAASAVRVGSATCRFSSTVPSNSVGRWKTIPTLRRRASGSRSATSSPRKPTVPDVGTINRLQRRSMVDFPAPDGPASTVIPPSGRVTSTSSQHLDGRRSGRRRGRTGTGPSPSPTATTLVRATVRP